MKKLFSLLATVLFAGSMMAAESVVYTLTPASGSNNSYAGNCDIEIAGITWNLTGNSTMQPWRLGGKSITGVDRELYSKTAIEDNVSKIEIEHGTAANIEVNSFTVIVASDAEFDNVISTLNPEFVASETTTILRPEGADWSNAYYKFVYNVTVAGTSNKFVQFVGAKFYAEGEGGGESGEGIEYDEDADLTYAFNSYTVDDEYLLDDGDVIIEAFDEQAGYKVVLDLYVPLGASGLVAGTYPINDSYEASSVAAGLFDEGMIFPSYAGIVDGEGLLEKVWYLVSGTVTVSEELNIGVVAKNSLGHDITITIENGGEGTGVKNVAADEIKAIKRIENGQLVIIKNGVRYDATGTILK